MLLVYWRQMELLIIAISMSTFRSAEWFLPVKEARSHGLGGETFVIFLLSRHFLPAGACVDASSGREDEETAQAQRLKTDAWAGQLRPTENGLDGWGMTKMRDGFFWLTAGDVRGWKKPKRN